MKDEVRLKGIFIDIFSFSSRIIFNIYLSIQDAKIALLEDDLNQLQHILSKVYPSLRTPPSSSSNINKSNATNTSNTAGRPNPPFTSSSSTPGPKAFHNNHSNPIGKQLFIDSDEDGDNDVDDDNEGEEREEEEERQQQNGRDELFEDRELLLQLIGQSSQSRPNKNSRSNRVKNNDSNPTTTRRRIPTTVEEKILLSHISNNNNNSRSSKKSQHSRTTNRPKSASNSPKLSTKASNNTPPFVATANSINNNNNNNIGGARSTFAASAPIPSTNTSHSMPPPIAGSPTLARQQIHQYINKIKTQQNIIPSKPETHFPLSSASSYSIAENRPTTPITTATSSSSGGSPIANASSNGNSSSNREDEEGWKERYENTEKELQRIKSLLLHSWTAGSSVSS